MTMTTTDVAAIGNSRRKIAFNFAEFDRQWHPSMGGAAPKAMLSAAIVKETNTIREAGRVDLADALSALATDIMEAHDA